MARPPQKKRVTKRKGTEKFGQRRLEVRNAMIKDIPGIAHLVRRVYEDMPAYTHGEIRGQINNFKEGCFVALLDVPVMITSGATRVTFHSGAPSRMWRASADTRLVMSPTVEPSRPALDDDRRRDLA